MFSAREERGSMEFLATMGRKVTEHTEEDLSRDYTTAKIKAALK